MYTNANQPAFGIAHVDGVSDYGLTKRELIAAMALQGLTTCHPTLAAVTAVELADALIAALEKSANT